MPPLPFLRYDQLFPQETWAPQMPNQQGYGGPNVQEMYNQMYTPEHKYADQMGGMLEHFPQRNEPGLLRNIVASVAGFGGGPEEAEKVQYAPYNRELDDWKTRYGATKDAATLERYDNANERQYANQEVSRRLQERKQEEQERAAGVKETQTNQKIEISRMRATAYDFKQRNPQMELKEDKQGNLIGVNRITGDMQFIIDPNTGAPIKSSKMPEEDKINLQIQGRLGLAEAQHGYRKEEITQRADEARKTQKERQTGKSLSPAAVKVDRYNRAKQLIDQNPGWAGAIVIGRGSDFQIHEELLDPDEAEIIKEYIYQGDMPDMTPNVSVTSPGKGDIDLPADPGNVPSPSMGPAVSPQGGAPTPAAKPQQLGPAYQQKPVIQSGPKIKNPEDRVTVQYGNDKAISIPREQLQTAISRGFKEVR